MTKCSSQTLSSYLVAERSVEYTENFKLRQIAAHRH